MNDSRFAKICLGIALFAIAALAALAVARTTPGAGAMLDPFHGASQMPGDLANDRPAQSAELKQERHR